QSGDAQGGRGGRRAVSGDQAVHRGHIPRRTRSDFGVIAGMTRELPAPKSVKDFFEDLLGRPVTVSPADPLRAADITSTLVAVYSDPARKLGAVVGFGFSLTAYVGAAIGLIPA